MQEDLAESPKASIESLINIESLFSLLIISLIFRFDFSLTIELTRTLESVRTGLCAKILKLFDDYSVTCNQMNARARRPGPGHDVTSYFIELKLSE